MHITAKSAMALTRTKSTNYFQDYQHWWTSPNNWLNLSGVQHSGHGGIPSPGCKGCCGSSAWVGWVFLA